MSIEGTEHRKLATIMFTDRMGYTREITRFHLSHGPGYPFGFWPKSRYHLIEL